MIRTSEKRVILVDGGPDRSVLDCLSKHLPFWQRAINLVLLSHPHADHSVGFLYVSIQYFIFCYRKSQ